jgi:hypothetical protein
VLIDDKVRILAATKQAWDVCVTTIFPSQGHHAHDEKEVAKYPPPDLKVERNRPAPRTRLAVTPVRDRVSRKKLVTKSRAQASNPSKYDGAKPSEVDYETF